MNRIYTQKSFCEWCNRHSCELKGKGDLVKEGRELFLGDDQARKMSMLDNYLTTEFDGLAMDGKSLEIISKFLPKLEELHLDGVFLETKIFKEMREN